MGWDNLTEGEKFIAEWQHNMAGGFKTALLHAIAKADSNNQEKLKLGFYDEVTAYQNYTNIEDWWENLKLKIEEEVGHNG